MRSLVSLVVIAGAVWALVVAPTTATGPGLRGAASLVAPTAPPPAAAPPVAPPPVAVAGGGAATATGGGGQADPWPGYLEGLNPSWHAGAFDFVAPEGTPVYAPASGALLAVGSYTDPTRYGAYVIILTPRGLEIYMGHLNHEDVNPLGLEVGGWVEAGVPVGFLSEFPYSTPHAHIQLRRGGALVSESEWWVEWSAR